MHENDFRLLMGVMKLMEEGDLRNTGMENVVIKVIDKFNQDLTAEQKGKILKQFIDYHKIKVSGSGERFEKLLKEEEGKSMMRHFYDGGSEVW